MGYHKELIKLWEATHDIINEEEEDKEEKWNVLIVKAIL